MERSIPSLLSSFGRRSKTFPPDRFKGVAIESLEQTPPTHFLTMVAEMAPEFVSLIMRGAVIAFDVAYLISIMFSSCVKPTKRRNNFVFFFKSNKKMGFEVYIFFTLKDEETRSVGIDTWNTTIYGGP